MTLRNRRIAGEWMRLYDEMTPAERACWRGVILDLRRDLFAAWRLAEPPATYAAAAPPMPALAAVHLRRELVVAFYARTLDEAQRIIARTPRRPRVTLAVYVTG